MATDAYFPPLLDDDDTLEKTAEKQQTTSKRSATVELILELLLYTAELIVPILMWSCVVAILAGFIRRSNWNFTTQMVFYSIIAIFCLLFLLVRHGANHVIAKKLANV